MRRLILLLLLFAFAPIAVQAQSNPNWALGYVPPAAEWNLWWTNKTDVANGSTTSVTATGSGASKTLATWIGNVATTVSAAGTNQGTATVLTSQFNIVTTVTAGTGVMATAGYSKIWNAGANALLVYPISSAQFDAVGTNLPVTVPVGGAVEIEMTSTTQGYAR